MALLPALLPCAARAQTQVEYHPLDASERWHEYWKNTLLSPGLFFAALGAASGSQMANDPPEWKQGTQGYAKRTASFVGLFAVQETIHQGGAAALGYDPRFFRCDCKGALRRSAHAFKWSFLTRDREGRTRVDFPTIAGAYGSGMLSMYWYPSRFQPLTDGFRTGNQQMGFVVGINMVKEFSPELRHVFTFGKR